MKPNSLESLVAGRHGARVARIILAVSAITMFVLSAGAPGATGWK